MTLTTRRATAIGALLAVTLVLSACQNLPRRTAGAKCKTVGEHAQDGTWVLKCGSNKRWNKLMTIAAANDAVANWLRSAGAAGAAGDRAARRPGPHLDRRHEPGPDRRVPRARVTRPVLHDGPDGLGLHHRGVRGTEPTGTR